MGRLLSRVTPAGVRALAVAGAAVLVIVTAGAVLAVGSPEPAAVGAAAAVAAGGQSSATLRIVSGTPLLSVGVADLGGRNGTLVRAVTAAGAPVRPDLRKTGSGDATSVQLSLPARAGAGNGASPVTVTLNAAVTWAIDFAGGTDRTVADLRGGHVAVLLFTAGSSVIDVTLPRPRGTVPVILAGGASRLLLRLPDGVPARVTAGGGAGEVVLDGTPRTGVAGGTALSSPGWPAAGPRFDVDAIAGAALISVTRWQGLGGQANLICRDARPQA
jgi:hypothetical protein